MSEMKYLCCLPNRALERSQFYPSAFWNCTVNCRCYRKCIGSRRLRKKSLDIRGKSWITCYHCHHAYSFSARKEKTQLKSTERRDEVRVKSGFEFKKKKIKIFYLNFLPPISRVRINFKSVMLQTFTFKLSHTK